MRVVVSVNSLSLGTAGAKYEGAVGRYGIGSLVSGLKDDVRRRTKDHVNVFEKPGIFATSGK